MWYAYENIWNRLWFFDQIIYDGGQTSRIPKITSSRSPDNNTTSSIEISNIAKREMRKHISERRNQLPVILIAEHFNRISIVFNLLHGDIYVSGYDNVFPVTYWHKLIAQACI